MPLLHRLKMLWRNVARKTTVESDLDAEVRSYREMLEDEKRASGADPRTARREALLELGGADQIKEEVRDVRLGASLDAMGSELRQSLRGLRRNPGLTVLAIGMLALGMGAGTVVFSIFYSALLRPLPFRDSQYVVQLAETRLARGIDDATFSEANFWDFRAQQRSFEEVGAAHFNEANLTGMGAPEKVRATEVSAGFFRTLGVSPVLGRDFSYEEERENAGRVALIGNRFWKGRLGGDPNILGKTLRLNDRPYTVIGVLPYGEPWLRDQIYIPFMYRPNQDRGSWEFDVIGRLKPGVSMDAARADLKRVAAGLAEAYPKDDAGIGFRLDPSSTWIASASTRRALWVLLGAVTFLLMIGCLNIANLLLARGTARQREIAVRTALGAGRARLVRFVMMESLLLSGFGAALGVALAYGALGALRALEINAVPRLVDATLNPWVLAFSGAIALATGVLSGIAPALQAPISGIAAALRDGDRQTGSRGQTRLRAALVAGEVALSFLLLAGAGLLMRSFTHLMRVDRGFHTENRLVFSVSIPDSYKREQAKRFLDEFRERLSGMPEVIAAGAVSHRPVEGGNPGMGIDAATGPAVSAKAPWAGWRVVTPGYFRAVGLPLLRGRDFEAADPAVWKLKGDPEPQRRVVISERLAKLIFPKQDALGRHVALWKGQNSIDAEVIGIVGDSRERGLSSPPALTVYLPVGKLAVTEFVLHTRGNPMAIAPTVRSIVASLDPNLPVMDVRSFEEIVERSVSPQRFNAILLSIFSGLALLLATTGIYGVLSYSMSRRTPEIGLRVALGASRSDILRMAIAQGMRPASIGIVIGAAGAVWLTRYFTTLLFGIKAFDPLTYAAVAVLLAATALAACYVPGHRAMRIDPAVALRLE
jgi:putative ABC transport system permease protein